MPINAEAFVSKSVNFKDMEDYGCALIVPISIIERAYGLYRAKAIDMVSRGVKTALKCGVDIAVVTMAEKKDEMLSYMQLAEISAALGIGGALAKESLSKTNKRIFVEK